MLQTHKYHINTSITGTCIKQSFTISYIHKFICMLKASKEESVRNAYIVLTEEKRQHVTILNCFGVILEVGLFLLWSFKRFTALKTFIQKLIAEGTLKNQKYGHLGTLCETR
ncbi:hypothetical protein T01_3642 [Trichinella spiralis]|uniref:Uncharacterized protein n=1 Tax=Trichinella spiralis TaxID=6334 RepID=A0A0V1AX36_TRISP|nr:hypothetical protein T01_978 [Trichinella spiralis]KRY39601.1 hypothetical protein T01_3642 [Trichinella spiralis]